MKLTLLALVLAIGAASALPTAASTVVSPIPTLSPHPKLNPLSNTHPQSPTDLTSVTYPIQSDIEHLLQAAITALRKLPGDLTQIPNRFENGEGELEAITAITTPLLKPVFDLLEDVMGDLEGLPAALAAGGSKLGKRDAEAQLEVVGDIVRPIVGPGADELEDLQALLEGGLIPN
jgi:hypothetical protein